MSAARDASADRSRPATHDAAGASAGSFRPRVSPYCASLSSKKILGSTGLPMTDADVLDASNWCWCARTAALLGPDRKPAHPEDCRSGRGCFHSPYAGLL